MTIECMFSCYIKERVVIFFFEVEALEVIKLIFPAADGRLGSKLLLLRRSIKNCLLA